MKRVMESSLSIVNLVAFGNKSEFSVGHLRCTSFPPWRR
jgi:hypothetical protein